MLADGRCAESRRVTMCRSRRLCEFWARCGGRSGVHRVLELSPVYDVARMRSSSPGCSATTTYDLRPFIPLIQPGLKARSTNSSRCRLPVELDRIGRSGRARAASAPTDSLGLASHGLDPAPALRLPDQRERGRAGIRAGLPRHLHHMLAARDRRDQGRRRRPRDKIHIVPNWVFGERPPTPDQLLRRATPSADVRFRSRVRAEREPHPVETGAMPRESGI